MNDQDAFNDDYFLLKINEATESLDYSLKQWEESDDFFQAYWQERIMLDYADLKYARHGLDYCCGIISIKVFCVNYQCYLEENLYRNTKILVYLEGRRKSRYYQMASTPEENKESLDNYIRTVRHAIDVTKDSLKQVAVMLENIDRNDIHARPFP